MMLHATTLLLLLFTGLLPAALAADLLLVDDDGNEPAVQQVYVAALGSLGLVRGADYDIYDVAAKGSEPDAGTLAAYREVIWFSGAARSGAGPEAAGEAALAAWLDAGGCLLLSSQDYIYDKAGGAQGKVNLTPFMRDYLGIADAINDLAQGYPQPVYYAFGELYGSGPYPVDFAKAGLTDRSDALLPTADGQYVLIGETYGPGITHRTLQYRSLFAALAVEAMTAPAELLDRFRSFCEPALPATGTYHFERAIPSLADPVYFAPGRGLLYAEPGQLFLSSDVTDEVYQLTTDGGLVTRWGRTGTTDGQFRFPGDLGRDADGNLYVADIVNHRIQKFGPNGDFLLSWGSEGNLPGQFSYPSDAKVLDGRVYVADARNHRIQVFSTSGEFLFMFGTHGLQPGQIRLPGALAVDPRGYLYVLDGNYRTYGLLAGDRVQKFDPDGALVTGWANGGVLVVEGDLDGAVDPDGNLVVATDRIYSGNPNRYTIARFDPDGNPLNEWNTPLNEALTVDERGHVWLSSRASVIEYAPSGQQLSRFGSNGSKPGQFDNPYRVDLDAEGNVYVLDTENRRVQRFDADLAMPVSFGDQGSGQALLSNFASGIEVDAARGYVYVADGNVGKLRRYRLNGSFDRYWGAADVPQALQAEFNPLEVTVAPDGSFFVSNASGRIFRFTANGTYDLSWVVPNLALNFEAINMDIGPDGLLYLALKDTHEVRVYAQAGFFVAQWPKLGPDGAGLLQEPTGIHIDANGIVYIASNQNGRVMRFLLDGTYIDDIGGPGTAPDRFMGPRNVAVDATGRVYVADRSANRVQRFDQQAAISNTRAIIAAGSGGFTGNFLWPATRAMANKAYRTLRHLGLSHEDIYYLSSDTNLDIDGDGTVDVDADMSNFNLQQAIQVWATQDANGDGQPDATNLVVYLTGHGGSAGFRSSATELLPAAALNSWLASTESALPGIVVSALDFCESGGFQAGAGSRVTLTSTAPDQAAYFTGNGHLSFSSFLLADLFNGRSLGDAFGTALGNAGGISQVQTPLGNADGDRVYNEGYDPVTGHPLAPPSGDYAAMQNLHIGGAGPAGADAPSISGISGPQTIAGTASALLEAFDVVDPDGIDRVWAVIGSPGGPGAPDNPVIGLPAVNLVDDGTGRYQVVYDGFHGEGVYPVWITAQDRLGHRSTPLGTTVTVGSPPARRAVIVAGGTTSDPGWAAVEYRADAVYRALRAQGYDDDRIAYLKANLSEGVDAAPSLSNLLAALAASGGAQDVLLYLLGPAQGLRFGLSDSEVLLPGQLDSWLDVLLAATSGKIVVAADFANAGVYLSRLSAPSGEEQNLYRLASDTVGNDPAQGDGASSYTGFLMTAIGNGAKLAAAHLQARSALLAATGRAQEPWIDTDSDGIADKFDIARVVNYAIGHGVLLAGDAPVLSGAGFLGNPLAPALDLTLYLNTVTSTSGITEVWAEVRHPDLGGPVPAPQKLPLSYNGQQWLGNLSIGAPAPGVYTVSFYARDQHGNVSLPQVVPIVRMDSNEPDDTVNQAQALTVDDPAGPQLHTLHNYEDQDWYKLELQPGTYTITVEPQSAGADLLIEALIPANCAQGQNCLVEDTVPAGEPPLGREQLVLNVVTPTTLLFRVGMDAAHSTQFTSYLISASQSQGGGFPGFIEGLVLDQGTSGPVSNALLATNGNGFDTSATDGSFRITEDAGTYQVTAQAVGYQQAVAGNVTVVALGSTPLLLQLAPDAVDSDGDGLTDAQEIQLGTQPNQADSDGDGLCDGPVVVTGICEGGEDRNGNGVIDGDETDPTNPDSDGDGFSDYDEVIVYGSNPNLATDTPANGDANESGALDPGDLLICARIGLGLVTPTVAQLTRCDVQPVIGGIPVPDGHVGPDDLLSLLRQL